MKFAELKCINAIAIALCTLLAIPSSTGRAGQTRSTPHAPSLPAHRFRNVRRSQRKFITQGVGAQVLNSRGVVTGSADTSIPDPNAPNCLNPLACFISHAFKWRKGSLTDLGALPGVNSSFGSWITANGLVAGISGNGEIDPLTGGPEERAVLWKDRQIIDLGTLAEMRAGRMR
jgi:hypothetical protein